MDKMIKNMKKRKNKKQTRDFEITEASVYKELGYKNYEEMETKSDLITEISKAIKQRNFTQTQAAELFKISQPKLSELLSGHFRGYSVERLMHFLNEIGEDIDIVVKTKPRNRKARIKVYHSTGHCESPIALVAKGKN